MRVCVYTCIFHFTLIIIKLGLSQVAVANKTVAPSLNTRSHHAAHSHHCNREEGARIYSLRKVRAVCCMLLCARLPVRRVHACTFCASCAALLLRALQVRHALSVHV